MIEEGNWLCLNEQMSEHRGSGFDAIICMGNSFAHLPDFSGDQHDQRTAITNFYELLKPGGILVIDHRNYDYILEHGAAPTKNIYYSVNIFCPQFLISLMSPFCDLLSLNWAELGRVAFSPNSICVLHVVMHCFFYHCRASTFKASRPLCCMSITNLTWLP